MTGLRPGPSRGFGPAARGTGCLGPCLPRPLQGDTYVHMPVYIYNIHRYVSICMICVYIYNTL